MKTILCIFGTRPEAIKFAPLIKVLQESEFKVVVVVTGQHREMLDHVLSFFNIQPDYDLHLMTKGQSLFDITVRSLTGLETILEKESPDLIFVQGDTTTAFVGALSGYYKKIKIAHLEAGLRSHNKYSPFPEEMNRILAGHLADYHFAPTKKAQQNLAQEEILNDVFVVGNTVIDALHLGLRIIQEMYEEEVIKKFSFIDFSKRVILVTAHRRENLGPAFEQMCQAMIDIIKENTDVELVYPVHLNPKVQEPVQRILKGHHRIHLIAPLQYPEMIWLMQKSYLVLTDSGGIQEEAPALGKPVLVMREVTERQEGVDAGTAKLVGTNQQKIFEMANELLNNVESYKEMAHAVNPYGDGTASQQILKILRRAL